MSATGVTGWIAAQSGSAPAAYSRASDSNNAPSPSPRRRLPATTISGNPSVMATVSNGCALTSTATRYPSSHTSPIVRWNLTGSRRFAAQYTPLSSPPPAYPLHSPPRTVEYIGTTGARPLTSPSASTSSASSPSTCGLCDATSTLTAFV